MSAVNPPTAPGRAVVSPSAHGHWTPTPSGSAVAGARVPHWRTAAPTPVRERVVVVSARPGEETLAAAGLLLWCAHHGVEIVIAALTDGEDRAGRAGSDQHRSRAAELDAALAVLGVRAVVRWFGLNDDDVRARGDVAADRLGGLLDDRTVCVAPWRFDGSPELEAASRAAAVAAHRSGAALWEAPVWGRLDGRFDLSPAGRRARALDLGPVLRARKQAAVAAFERPLVARDAVHPSVVAGRAVQALTTSVEWFWDPDARSRPPAEPQRGPRGRQ
jgi:LmbE family N-acetylglucosaminyl deacetylase